MDKNVKPVPLETSFDYELYEGDPDHLRTVGAIPAMPSPHINPISIKLKHRIGRGYFGDVWLATHHQRGVDYDEYHEVAVKMLYPISEAHVKHFITKFEEVWMNLKSKQVQGLCWLHGIYATSGKICIAMKFYEGSIGDRMARLKGGKLPLSDVLRYGIELAKGIQEMHSMDILVLNLKPTNFLLNEFDQAFLDDMGIPYLLLGVELPDSDFAFRLGTPNYMAPEQWQPEVRGPISYETDSWGFGCSIVEMLTGIQPWFGKSAEEIYQSVLENQEKPQLPSGLPPAVENVLRGCFEYDLRNRPLMLHILQAFESSRKAVYSEGEWIGPASTLLVERPNSTGYTTWFLLKGHLQVGDTVRSRNTYNSCKPQSIAVMEGTVVGLEKDMDRDGFVLVRVPSSGTPLRVNMSTVERITHGLAAGDWVRLNTKKNKNYSSVGILHSIQRDGIATVGFLGLETLWKGNASELQMVERLWVGQFVRLKENIVGPRFDWQSKSGRSWATGRISQILPNGCLLVGFPGRFVFGNKPEIFLADPDQVEVVSFHTCPGFVEKYQHVEDFHWAVRPLAITFGLFVTGQLGIYVGKNIGAKVKKCKKKPVSGDDQDAAVAGGSSTWIPPPVANIIFKDGNAASR